MVGDEISNQILSQKRAQSVVDYLISKGIDPKRLIAKGYGESQPKVITEKLAKLDHKKQQEPLELSCYRSGDTVCILMRL